MNLQCRETERETPHFSDSLLTNYTVRFSSFLPPNPPLS